MSDDVSYDAYDSHYIDSRLDRYEPSAPRGHFPDIRIESSDPSVVAAALVAAVKRAKKVIDAAEKRPARRIVL